MKQILVAVDEHPHAEQIVDAAIQLAEATSAKILLIYVVSVKSLPSGYRESDGTTRPRTSTRTSIYARSVRSWKGSRKRG